MVKSKRVMLRTFIWPGWGHLALGKRKKGWFLWWSGLVSVMIICWGLTIYLVPEGVSTEEEEVTISQSGIIAEEMLESSEEVAQGEVNPFVELRLPLTITLLGLILLAWVSIYAYRDTRRLVKKQQNI